MTFKFFTFITIFCKRREVEKKEVDVKKFFIIRVVHTIKLSSALYTL
tara:strand:+ start:7939 stop:8079 length:141 start_codon:yes stop_codon:yes gene_type:complete